jgi:hypothetical protein
MPAACARRAVCRAPPSELRRLRRAAGCRSVRFRDDRQDAAEIATEDHPVSVDHRDAEVRPDALGRELPPDAFLAARRDGLDIDRAGQAALEISGRLEELLPDAVRRAHLLEPLLDLPQLAAAREAQQVVESCPQAQLRVALQSAARLDAQLDASSDASQVSLPEPRPDAVQQRLARQPRAPRLLTQERAGERPEQQQAQAAESRAPARQASQEQPWERQRELAALSLPWPRQSSPLPQRLPLRPSRGNASAPARRARYQSNSSASSFP